jgi:hypothetical protein
MNSKKRTKSITALGFVALIVPAIVTSGCTKSDLAGATGDLAAQCGLECPVKGIAQGNASISGVASVDAFFGAVVNFNAKATLVTNNINGELAKIKASLGLPATASGADISAAITTNFQLMGGVKVAFQPAQCSVDAQATIDATASCDATVTPGSASVQCSGTCEAKAGATVDCGASAMVECSGTAPSLQCAGTCTGSCDTTCQGTCDGTCSAVDAMGKCNGTCTGTCSGTCMGQCKGNCVYTPPSGMCDATAQVHCKAMGTASVQCNGKCDGEVTPPMASAECQASAKASASVDVSCTPPSLGISYTFAATADATAQANFQAFLVGFKASFGNIVADLAQADVVLKAGADLSTAATGAVSGSINASLSGKLDLKSTVGLGCAVTALGDVAGVVTTATTGLSGSVTAAGSLTAALSS